MDKTYYTVYKVTNKISGKLYVGVHKTKNLDDGYMGSGKYLGRAIEKHGIENFSKEILFVFDNPEDMFLKEAEIVNEDFIEEENTYNLRVGGSGGWDYVNKTNLNLYETHKERSKENLSIANEKKLKLERESESFRADQLKRSFNALKSSWDNNPRGTFFGKSHSEETKLRISKASSKHQAGQGNSQYGTMWIHSPSLKKCKKIRVDEDIPQGWVKGRKMNFPE